MARSSVRTKLSIDEWGKIVGINPLHLNQVQLTSIQKLGGKCTQAWFQYEWQDIDRVGRELVGRSILEAEAELEEYLGFRLMPSWEADEWIKAERPYYKELIGVGLGDVRGFRQIVVPRHQRLIAPGIRASSLADSACVITWSDADADGYKETGTILVNTTVTEPCELRVYYPGKNGADIWEIRPITVVSIAAGVATITFRRELTVKESLQEPMVPTAVDGTSDGNFLATVDVYRVYNDTTTQATLVWEPIGSCDCGSLGCSCAYSVQTACLVRRGDERLGVWAYQPATWDAEEEIWSSQTQSVCRWPDAVRLWYYGGYQSSVASCPRNTMDQRMAQAVAYLACSKLDRPFCEAVPHFIDTLRDDLALTQSRMQGRFYQVSSSDLNCPFGTTRGAILAWRMIKAGNLSVAAGVTV